VNRTDYLALFSRIDDHGADSRFHWASGPRAGETDPWDGTDAALPGRPARGLGQACRETDGGCGFAETLMGEPRLVIAGAGHVGTAFAHIAVMLGFRVTVIDERPEFAAGDRLPVGVQVVCGGYAETLAALPDYANTYYVLVTPGHRQDRECAQACLAKPFEYVGMIGSRGKVAAVNQALAEAGVPAEKIAALHAPIGLPLGGREPAEIAVSIAAEVVQVRAARSRATFDPAVRDVIEGLGRRPDREAVLATIVGHGGSVPRGMGSRMLVDLDGPLAGSVGGGAVEHAAILAAQEMLRVGPEIDLVDYELSDREGASLGMICGGQLRVLFEVL
jgi:xanthine dehydrogenase accessory factor